MRHHWVIAAAFAALILQPNLAAADDTVFDFVGPRASQLGTYVAGTGAVVSGGFGTLAPIAGWYDEAWGYRLSLSIDNPGATPLSEWPVDLLLDAASPGGALVWARGQATGADLRLVGPAGVVTRMCFGLWDAAVNRGRVWFQMPSIAAGNTNLSLYFGHPGASNLDDPAAVFTYSTRYASRYALEPAGNPMEIVSMVNANAYATGAQSGTLMAGGAATIASADWTSGQAISSVGPLEVGYSVDGASEAAPVAFAATTHSVVVNRGVDNTFVMLSLANTTVTVSVNGTMVTTVALTAGTASSYVQDLGADDVIRFDAAAPFMVTHRGTDVVDGFVLPPPASEVWGVRSGTPRVLAIDARTKLTIYDSSGGMSTVTIDAGAFATLTAGGSGDGDAIRIVAEDATTGAPTRITVVGNADGDGGDAIAFHPERDLGRTWVVPTDGRFVLIATSQPSTTCTLTPPVGAATQVTSSASRVPPYPGRVKFGADTGTNVLAGSVIRCDAASFAYYEDAATDDERNLYPMTAHRKVGPNNPATSLGGTSETRYVPAVGVMIDTPDFVAPTGVIAWTDFRDAASIPAGTTVVYQVSVDAGTTYLVPSGGSWGPTPDPLFGVSADAIRSNLSTLDAATGRLRIRAVLATSDGVNRPAIDAIRVFYSATSAADRLVWGSVPSTVNFGEAFSTDLTALNTSGATITGIGGTVTFTASHGGAVLPASVTLAAGQVSFDIKVLGVADDVVLRADGPGGLVGFSTAFDLVAPGGASVEIAGGNNQFAPVEGLLAEPLVALVKDASNTPIPGVQVTFAVLEGGGSFAPGGATSMAATTDTNGLARVYLRVGAAAGAQRVRAEAVGGMVEFVARADEGIGLVEDDGGCCSASEGDAPPLGVVLLTALVALALVRRRRGRFSRSGTRRRRARQ